MRHTTHTVYFSMCRGVARDISMYRNHYSKGVRVHAPRKMLISYIAAAAFLNIVRHILKDFIYILQCLPGRRIFF